MSVKIIIPARYGSSRLLGKPLLDICGKPMIQHVVEKANQVSNVDAVYVATDDKRIYDVVQSFGGNAVMTSVSHISGTDRIVEVLDQIDADVYVNIQGDEPLIEPNDITKLIEGMTKGVEIGSLYHQITPEEANNPNQVKVVFDNNNDALYFSRSKIPFDRDELGAVEYYKHVGVYAYTKEVLMRYAHLPISKLENIEKLEQLRLLSNGYRIRLFEVEPTGPGVDTEACLNKVRKIMYDKLNNVSGLG